MRNIFIVLLFIGCITLTSATGLTVSLNHSHNLSKDYEVELQIPFEIHNDETFTFYNITFEENDFIRMDKITKIDGGQYVLVNATYYGNVDFDGEIKIKGEYYSNQGSSSENYVVDVEYEGGAVTPCQLTIIEGDTVKWDNLAEREIKLVNADTGSPIATIDSGSFYEQTFNEPLNLDYYFTWLGFKFSNECSIIAQDDYGLITNPLFDSQLNLDIQMTTPPTTLISSFLVLDYNMHFFESEEGAFTIKNNGSELALDVHITGDWFSFSDNDFDLEAGKTKVITYTIKPEITLTAQTDQEYNKTVTITGNFNKMNQSFNIYVLYDDIDSGEDFQGASFYNWFLEFCEDNPNDRFCRDPLGEAQGIANEANLSQEQFRQIIEYMFSQEESFNIYKDITKEQMTKLAEDMMNVTGSQLFTRNSVERILDDKENNYASILLIFVLILGFGALAVVGALFVITKRDRQKKFIKNLYVYERKPI